MTKSTNGFYSTIAEYYDRIFPLQPQQVQFLNGFLADDSAVLDVGCATGSLLIALATKQRKVVGIDLDPALIKIAQQKIEDAKSTAEVMSLDMLRLASQFAQQRFHGVTCLGNTLSHLSPVQLSQALTQICGCLAPGGFFVGQIVNCDRLLSLGLSTLPTIKNGPVRFVRNYRNFNGTDSFAFHTHLMDSDAKLSLENEVTLFPIRQKELHQTLVATGFEEVRFFGNYKGAPAGTNWMPLIFVAKRKG